MDLDEFAQRHVEGRKPAEVPETPIREPIVIEDDEDGWPIMPEILRRRT